jgi:pyrroline-5-carboxylate reductase
MSQSAFRLGLLGGGNMAEAIIKGVIAAGILRPSELFVTDISEDRRRLLRETYGVEVFEKNGELVSQVDVVLFAVKPQNMPVVLEEIRPVARPEQLFVSICAGTTTAIIEKGLESPAHGTPRVVRVMPNTPALISMGMAGMCKGAHASDADIDRARVIFDAVGEVVAVPESMMDAVTALIGSGPAYVFYLIESLIEAARKHGFSDEQARSMVLATVRGAATLAHGSPLPPAQLRRNVTSPGGTTAAGLAVLEERKVKDAFIACVDAAEHRGKELAANK